MTRIRCEPCETYTLQHDVLILRFPQSLRGFLHIFSWLYILALLVEMWWNWMCSLKVQWEYIILAMRFQVQVAMPFSWTRGVDDVLKDSVEHSMPCLLINGPAENTEYFMVGTTISERRLLFSQGTNHWLRYFVDKETNSARELLLFMF